MRASQPPAKDVKDMTCAAPLKQVPPLRHTLPVLPLLPLRSTATTTDLCSRPQWHLQHNIFALRLRCYPKEEIKTPEQFPSATLQHVQLGQTAVSCRPSTPTLPRWYSVFSPTVLKQLRLANAVGTQEPIYGPEAVLPVTKQAEATPYTELTRSDHKWETPTSSCVETQTFYIFSDAGHVAFVQVIYSNVA
jgi:hypothetical protein